MSVRNRTLSTLASLLAACAGTSTEPQVPGSGEPADLASPASPAITAPAPEAEAFPAPPAANIPGHPLEARFWAEVDPSGRIELTPLPISSNTIGLDPLAGQTTVTPASSRVQLFADPARTTFIDEAGVCHSGGALCGSPGVAEAPAADAVCGQPLTVCAPVTAVNSQPSSVLADVTVQVENELGSQQVQSCFDQPLEPGWFDPFERYGAFGQCHFDAAGKLDSSALADLDTPVAGCSYCYGNRHQASIAVPEQLGRSAALIGSKTGRRDAALDILHTDVIAMHLEAAQTTRFVLTVRSTTPRFISGGKQIDYAEEGGTGSSCAQRGKSTAYFYGGAFGAPAECLAGDTCPFTGSAPGGSRLDFPGMSTEPNASSWSDTWISAPVPAQAVACPVTVHTPGGSISTAEPLALCGHQWRSWTPLYRGRPLPLLQPAVGVLDDTIIIQGGRRGVADFAVADATTYALPAPTCATPTPGFLKIETTGDAPAVWGAAATVANHRFYVLGGTASGAGECSRAVRYFERTGETTGRWVTLAAQLPDGLCHAAATTLTGADGHQWILVTGGSRRSVPNNDCTGGVAADHGRALLLDSSSETPTWIEYASAGEPGARWGAAVATSSDGKGTIIMGGSMDAELPGSAMSSLASLRLDGDGVPMFATVGAAPGERYLAAMATASGTDGASAQFMLGGATEQSPSSQCGGARAGRLGATDTLWVRDEQTGELVAGPAAPSARAGHAFVTVGAFGGQKLYAIGGQDDGTPVVSVDEYTP